MTAYQLQLQAVQRSLNQRWVGWPVSAEVILLRRALSGRFRLIAEVHQRLLGGTSLLENCALTATSKACGSIKTQSLSSSPSRTQIAGDGNQRP